MSQYWTEVYYQILAGSEVKTLWNLYKKCVVCNVKIFTNRLNKDLQLSAQVNSPSNRNTLTLR